MPELWNNILVVTKDELAPWYTEQALKNSIQRYKNKDYGIKRACRAHNGTPLLIIFDSLSKEIQTALGDPRKCDHVLELYYKIDGGAVNYYSTFRFPDNTYLDDIYQEQYTVNASVMEALKRLKHDRELERRTKKITLHGVNQTLWNDAMSFQATLKAKHGVQHTLPEAERSFINKFHEYCEDGYLTLISGKHKNQNTRKVTDKTLDLLNAMFATDKTKPTATEVYRRYDAFLNGYCEVVVNNTAELYDRKDFKKLSDATVKNYMAQWANKIGTYQHRSTSRKDLMALFKPHHSYNKTKFAGSIISIDDRQPPFKALDGKRPWFYNAIDLGSECFTVAVDGDTKEGIITEFYRQMVRNYAEWGFHLPHQVECEMSLNSSFTNTFLREGAMFQKVSMLPNNPRGKRIERYFRELRYEYEKDREGWLARPHARSEANQPLIDTEKVARIPYEDIIEGCYNDIEQWNSRKHSIHTHLTRWEVFCQMQHPDLKPTNYQAILPHIGRKEQSSVNVGIIRFRSSEFLLGESGKVALGDKLINLMKQVEGKDIDIYWLDANDGSVLKALVYIGTQYICDAVAKPRYTRADLEMTEQDKTAKAIMNAYDATINSYGRRKKQQIEAVTIIKNTAPEPVTFKMPGRPNKKQATKGDGSVLPDINQDDYLVNLNTIPTHKKSMFDRF
ncbi:hypothetical protein AB6735_18540 [Mucilaginibacter sp. RCC_168]|uniref:hypothetical protein n=1 Tax=Mucilaginibacter sp. RCC_168 TaxID=3239221 RepID=UPI00352520B2